MNKIYDNLHGHYNGEGAGCRGKAPKIVKRASTIGITVILLLVLLLSSQHVTSAPVINIYEGYEKGVWDCSNIAAMVFTIKQWEGANVTIECGCANESSNCHAWVEEDGVVIAGGEDTWLGGALVYRRHSFVSIEEAEKAFPGQWNITKFK